VSRDEILLITARSTLERKLNGVKPSRNNEDSNILQQSSQGVFVTLYLPEKRLRGCIGHLSAVFDTIGEEIESCALASGFQDPRFPSLTASELEKVSIEISLLEPDTPVENISELDPKKFGIIIESGTKKGVLLPDIDGVDTVSEQISITLQKAGIAPNESYEIKKFEVTKISES